MTAKTEQDIAELFNTTKSLWWICPVTGKRFNADEVQAIEAHKTEVLTKARKQQEQARLQKQINSFKAQEFTAKSIAEFYTELNTSLIKFADIGGDGALPVLEARRIKKLGHTFEQSDTVYFVLKNYNRLTDTIKQMLTVCANDKFSEYPVGTLKLNSGETVISFKASKCWALIQLSHWQRSVPSKEQQEKEDNNYLSQINEVRELKKFLKDKSAQVHELRQIIRDLQKNYKHLRQKHLSNRKQLFEESPNDGSNC